MVRLLSVDEAWNGVTRSATPVSPAAWRSRAGIGCETINAEATCSGGNAVGACAAPAPRPQAARTSDPPIATPALTRFIRSPQVSTFRARRLPSSARRSLDKLADLFLDGGGEPLQGKGGWPDVTVVEVCSVLETERRVSRLELLPALEEADNLAVL